MLSILIGANNCLACTTCGRFKLDVVSLLRGVREVQPRVPIALVTLVVGYDDCPMEALRARLRDAAREVDDARVVVVEGLALLPPEGRIAPSNPHPSAAGMAELAANLNAALGLGALRVRLAACDGTGRPRLLLSGLTAGGGFAAFVGSASVPLSKRRAWLVGHGSGTLAHAACAHRALMLAPLGHVHGTANADGRAELLLEHAHCDRSSWQLMDLSTCATSAVGTASTQNMTATLFGR